MHRWQQIHGERVNFAVMTTSGALKLNAEETGKDGEVYEARTSVGAFQIGEVPAAVLLSADGTVLVETAFGLESIVILFLSEVASTSPAPAAAGSSQPAASSESGPIAAPAGEAATPEAYLAWHAATLTALESGQALPAGLEALVWSPNAGLGDSLFGFTGWFQLAMRSGRLFFVGPDGGDDRTWRLGLTSPALDRDGAKHEVSLSQRGIAVHRVSGHPSAGDPLVEAADALPPLPPLDQTDLLRKIVAPSTEVQAIMAEYAPRFEGGRVLGLQLRTGTALPPDPAFLQPGEEAEFVRAAVALTGETGEGSWSVFVMSDDEPLKSRLQGELAAAGLDPFHLESSVLHSSRDSGNALDDEAVRQRLLRTCAEFFLFSQVDSAVITARSLFGRAALAYGGRTATLEVGS